MGLDMYLDKKIYCGYGNNEGKVHVDIPGVNEKDIKYIIERVGYWRKANQIHTWFVDNVQDGVDECQDADVTIEQLTELRDLCQQIVDVARLVPGQINNGYSLTADGRIDHVEEGMVVENPEDIEALLPTKGGFFFGSTDYDQWYLEDIKDTLDILNPVIANHTPGDWSIDYIYHSSW
jgi:hypothetical protein